jgi:hypothetical protein
MYTSGLLHQLSLGSSIDSTSVTQGGISYSPN